MNFYPILTLIFSIAVSSSIIPNAFSITNQNNSVFFHEEKCNDGSCIVTTCDNGQPCKTSTGSNNKTSTVVVSKLLANLLPY
jgi:hypothetical protein